MAQIIDPDDLRRFVGYCPECGNQIWLMFADKILCNNCEWLGTEDEVLNEKGLRRLKIKRLNEKNA